MQISSLNSTILISGNIEENLLKIAEKYQGRRLFILTDENTFEHCLPMVANIPGLIEASVITVGVGELHKTIETAVKIWSYLSSRGANRNSVLINLGGGMICDLGGFAASTFKRGMPFVNIPTTLLAQVDASVGGKTGINFRSLKNEVGVFNAPELVIVYAGFLKTLDKRNLLSGYAEMVKHALIYSEEHWSKLKQFDVTGDFDYNKLTTLIWKSIFIKNDFVQKDPIEKNLRKVLNFGHTIGHAFESYSMQSKKPLLHGEAIAHGMVCEMYLSMVKFKLPESLVTEVREFIDMRYGSFSFNETDFEALYDFMQHDKKNDHDKINFSLLKGIGMPEVNVVCNKDEIMAALRRYVEISSEK